MAQILLEKGRGSRTVKWFFEYRNRVIWNIATECGFNPRHDTVEDVVIEESFEDIETVLMIALDEYGITNLRVVADTEDEKQKFARIDGEAMVCVEICEKEG